MRIVVFVINIVEIQVSSVLRCCWMLARGKHLFISVDRRSHLLDAMLNDGACRLVPLWRLLEAVLC
jgi:hypothetical protein